MESPNMMRQPLTVRQPFTVGQPLTERQSLRERQPHRKRQPHRERQPQMVSHSYMVRSLHMVRQWQWGEVSYTEAESYEKIVLYGEWMSAWCQLCGTTFLYGFLRDNDARNLGQTFLTFTNLPQEPCSWVPHLFQTLPKPGRCSASYDVQSYLTWLELQF